MNFNYSGQIAKKCCENYSPISFLRPIDENEDFLIRDEDGGVGDIRLRRRQQQQRTLVYDLGESYCEPCTQNYQPLEEEEEENLNQQCMLTCTPYRPRLDQWGNIKEPIAKKLELIELIRKTRDQRKRRHAFKNTWEKNALNEIEARLKLEPYNPPISCSAAVNWKRWPPQLPNFPNGVNIPVKLYPQIDFDFRGNGSPEPIHLGIEARPIQDGPESMFSELKGILNKPQATSCTVTPTSLLFFQSEVGHKYSATLKILNKGPSPRNFSILRPSNKYFDVIWGAELNELSSMIPPGLSVKIIIEFLPKSDETIHDFLTININNDGNIVIPIISTNFTPPVLEVDELDCGCSIVGQTRIKSFEIMNYGGEGRFWMLTEREFYKEYLEIHKKTKPEDEDMDEAGAKYDIDGNRIVTNVNTAYNLYEMAASTPSKKALMKKKKLKKPKINTYKMGHLYIKPFKIFPSCFHLQKHQKITIKTRFRPTELGFQYEKIALLCDNGEVRWLIIKGVANDTEKAPLVKLTSKWAGPSCDLPTDLATNLSIDCGDLLPSEVGKSTIQLENTSSIPLYFFWSIRPTRFVPKVFEEGQEQEMIYKTDPGIQVLLGKGSGTTNKDPDFNEKSLYEWKDRSCSNNRNSTQVNPMMSSVQIYPAQGILSAFQTLSVKLFVDAPEEKLKFHSCVISLFIQQLQDRSVTSLLRKDLLKMITKQVDLINIPINFTDLIKSMPTTRDYDTPEHSDEEEEETEEAMAPDAENADESEEEEPKTLHKKKTKAKNLIFQAPLLFMKLVRRFKRRRSSKLQGNGEDVKGQAQFKLVKLKHPSDHRSYKKKDKNAEASAAAAMDNKKEHEKGGGGHIQVQAPQIEMPMPRPLSGYHYNAGNRTGVEVAARAMELFGEDYEEFAGEEGLMSDMEGPDFDPNPIDPSCSTKCLLAKQKQWLPTDSYLVPTYEIEVWARSIPIQVWFDPPIFIASGNPMDSVEKHFRCYNQTSRSIEIEWIDILNHFCAITVSPTKFRIERGSWAEFNITAHLLNYGKFNADLQAEMRLAFIDIPCKIPVSVEIFGGSIEILTPVIHFGLVALNSEKIRTIAIQNTGTSKITWRAEVADDELVDEENHSLPNQQQMQLKRAELIKVWPQWGKLEAGQTTGIQLYLSSEVVGKLALVVEITVDQNPSLQQFVPIYAEIQSPYLIIPNGIIYLENLCVSIASSCSSVVLVNPTTFFVNFSWRSPIGSDSTACELTIDPQTGVIFPHSSINCQLTILPLKKIILKNLFVPCCVEGMKEPLLMSINGKIHDKLKKSEKLKALTEF